MDEKFRDIRAREAAKAEYGKRRIQRGEDLRGLLADMMCLTEESPQVNGDDIYDALDEIGRCKAVEIALSKPVATGIEIEPLPNGEVLMLFRASAYDYGYTVGAQVFSSKCLAELCLVAQAHPQSRKAVNTLSPLSIRSAIRDAVEKKNIVNVDQMPEAPLGVIESQNKELSND